MTIKDQASDRLDESTLGVALSGGGVRAALLGAGALRAARDYAADHDKRILVSTVSGSALLALELAWSHAPNDEAALQDVAARITKHAYWLRRRWWVVASLVLLSAALVYAMWSYRQFSASATSLWAAPILLAVAMMLLALFRTQGLWYRSRRFPIALPHPNPNIYSAMPGDFPKNRERMLTLNNFVFNTTSLTDGRCVSFEGSSLPESGAVREFAEASAAFPGAFLPRALPEVEGLYADGGIYDNTGITYFHRLPRCPKHVVAVDAGVGSTPPAQLPYTSLNSLISRVPRLFGAAITLLLCGSIVAALVGPAWLPDVLFWLFLAAVLLISVVVPFAAFEGAWNDVRWFGRGWPTTLRVTSDLHLERFQTAQEARGGSLSVVTLSGLSEGARAKTQLWKLPDAIASDLLEAGYECTRSALQELR